MALKRAGAHRQFLSLCTFKASCVLSSRNETTELNYICLSLPVANADLLQWEREMWTTVIYKIWCTTGVAFNQGYSWRKESGYLSSFLFSLPNILSIHDVCWMSLQICPGLSTPVPQDDFCPSHHPIIPRNLLMGLPVSTFTTWGQFSSQQPKQSFTN